MKRFNVVIPAGDTGIKLYPMKQWLRDHLDRVPDGLDPKTSTSHELRGGLKKMGWSIQTTDSEVRLFPPEVDVTQSAIDAVLGSDEEDQGPQSAAAFALEYQLRDFLAQNLGSILVDGRKLHLYSDTAGHEGIEFPTAVGPIDILAKDETNAFVVFELKRAQSSDRAIGQLARYMGWVRKTIGKGQNVRGVIVAKTISDNLRYAAGVIPDVSLFEYDVSFQLKPAPAFSAAH